MINRRGMYRKEQQYWYKQNGLTHDKRRVQVRRLIWYQESGLLSLSLWRGGLDRFTCSGKTLGRWRIHPYSHRWHLIITLYIAQIQRTWDILSIFTSPDQTFLRKQHKLDPIWYSTNIQYILYNARIVLGG